MQTYRTSRRALLTLMALALVAALPSAAHAAPISFGPLQQLPKWDGGEPSIAFDPQGTGDAYVVAPQGIPTAAASLGGGKAASKGVGFWGSHDGGHSFPEVVNTGAAAGGGDSDVEVGVDHTVFTADLLAADTQICTSTDRGRSFPDCATPLGKNQQGPENDRQWLTHGPHGELYLTYHDFVAGFPVIERSTDNGQTFVPCGTIIDPAGPAAHNYTPQGGTLVSKPIVTGDGTVYVEFSTPDQSASPQGAPIDHLYMAVAHGGCSSATVFKNYTIYESAGASLANIFQVSAVDGAGTLYVAAAGQSGSGQLETNVWLFVSHDGGKTWSPPARVNPPDQHAAVLPAIAGGEAGNEVAIGWFGTSVSGDPNDSRDVWRYYTGVTFDGGASYQYATATPDPIHYQDICTQGVFCGVVPSQPGNRNLADFSSAAIDPATGCLALAIPGDPQNHPPSDPTHDDLTAHAFVALQNGGPCLTATGRPTRAASAGGSGAGGGAGAANTVCGARVGPRVSVARRALRASRRSLTLRGTAADRACSGASGGVRRVRVYVERGAGHGRCRFLGPNGRLGRARSCRKPVLLDARLGRGATSWAYSRRVRLASGVYRTGAVSTNAVGRSAGSGTATLRVR